MKKIRLTLTSFLSALVIFVLAIACVSEPSQTDPSRDVSSISDKAPGESESSKEEPLRYRGCDDGLAIDVAQRSAVVDLAVRQAEGELAKAPDKIKDQDFRSRIATFAAATIDDRVPLIAMDRSCWAEFYDGQKKLAAGDEVGAKDNGEAWRICLEAMFPDRVAIARPYFSCFDPSVPKSPARGN